MLITNKKRKYDTLNYRKIKGVGLRGRRNQGVQKLRNENHADGEMAFKALR